MNCTLVANSDMVEEYLAGRLGGEDAEAFEEHFFACDRCLEAIRRHAALLAELEEADGRGEAEPARPVWRWALAAALAALAVGLGLWSWKAGPPRPGESAIASLAVIEPAEYAPPRLRGTAGAAPGFRGAMETYLDGDYRGAIRALEAVARLDPDSPEAGFYLGVSYLLEGDDARGIGRLRDTVAQGETPFLEEARLYLAKALLRTGEVAAATAELQEIVRLRGEREGEARKLLERLALEGSSP